MTNNQYYLEMAELECDKLLSRYQTLQYQNELNKKNSELRCMMETGSLIELDSYFSEAEEKQESKLQTIGKKIWKQISKLFSALKKALFGNRKKDTKVNRKSKIETSGPLQFIIRNLKAAWNKVKSVVISGKQKLSENGNWKKLLAVMGVASAGVAIAAIFKKKSDGGKFFSKKATKNSEYIVEYHEVEETIEVMEDMTDTFKQFADKNVEGSILSDPENGEEIRRVESTMHTVTNALNEALNHVEEEPHPIPKNVTQIKSILNKKSDSELKSMYRKLASANNDSKFSDKVEDTLKNGSRDTWINDLAHFAKLAANSKGLHILDESAIDII